MNKVQREHPSSMRFGVMCTGTVFQRWQSEALNELRAHGHLVVLLIIDARKVPETSRLNKLLKKKRSTLLFSVLENRVFKPHAKMSIDLQQDLQGIDRLNCEVDKRGYSEYFSAPDVQAIREHRLDFILRFGFNILRGDILSSARFGVWSFHHDDEMLYRGGPPGFWEIYGNDPVSGAILQRLTDKLDGGVVMEKGYLKTTMHSYRENLNQLLMMSSSWPARVADKLSGNPSAEETAGAKQAIASSTTIAPVFKVPGNLRMLKFLWLLMRNRITFYYRDLLASETWNVGIIRKPIRDVALGIDRLRESDITWLSLPASSDYLADPAGFILAGKLHILVEEYSYADQRAVISEIIPDPVGAGDPVRVLGGTVHLSYPFVFEHNHSVYCLPESYQLSRITLYRRDLLTGTFAVDRILLTDVSAVDPTIMFFNDFWWLFFTSRENSNSHLYVYHSRELTGEFKPHRNNPVKTDIRSARPAGTPFISEDVLYRPAQDCSGTYGGRVALNRVLRLTPDDFEEVTVKFIEPVMGSKYDKGLHTISGAGNFTLIDGKRYNLNRHFFYHQLKKRLTRKDPSNV